ncbi:sensor histidine kinase [Olivibacter sitiensis]|uniref:sensor histidine kinase n=1 Tax=Olivibacter sitiensis TaxID=376470 RepID=UPI0004150395|nr:HAMP domain-containing sensor histidine kinase [Olivibacter sitiensis]
MRRSLVLFYALMFYAIAQIVWWGILLMEVEPNRKGMIVGEGFLFLSIFVVGAILLKRAIVREHNSRTQQHNFLLSVTHELKSPLASIKLYLQTILKRDLDREQRNKFLHNSLKDIERLDDMVGNILLATRLENLNGSAVMEDLNLSEIVEKVSDRLQIHACTSQMIQLDLEPDVSVFGDRFAITSVVTNLMENAIKYSPECANVQVNLRRNEQGKGVLVVADSGIGIADEEKKRIFNKFYRVGSEDTRKTKGTGLGLYIVKSVLDKHKAQIKVKNNVPHGTVFEVYFN